MPKLPKAPLQEAIFEIRWDLDVDPENNQIIDKGFQLAQGKLQDLAKARFPEFHRKMPHGFPDQLIQYQVVNQHWSGKGKWPVIQLGPGIFTVNETEANYDWPSTYFPLIKESIDWVFKAYDGQLKINNAVVRYVDSVKLKDYGFDGRWQDFVTEHFNFSFVNSFNTRGKVKGLQFSQLFELKDSSALHIAMNSGKYRTTDDDALIWQTAVSKQARFDKNSLISWLEYAHTTTSTLFKEMTKQSFYASFQ
ncbi:MAG: TIGR04255 family protein [Chryseolinea sp.]